MTTDVLPARWVLLASAGLACLLTGLAVWLWPSVPVFVPILLGVGLPPVVALAAGMRAWWQRVGVDLRLDQARAWSNELANEARELALRSEPVAAVPDPEPVRRAAWDAANITLFLGGQQAGGYSQPKMQSMISSDPWQAWSDFYAANPDGEPVLQRVPGKVGTRLAYRWTLPRVLFAIAQGELPTPPGPPPSVREFVPEKRAAEKAESSAGAVVEGVARPTN